MDRENRPGFDYLSIAETFFTRNGNNIMESVGYEMKRKATIPNTTCWCPLLWHFLTRK